jgi:hypothetical protein
MISLFACNSNTSLALVLLVLTTLSEPVSGQDQSLFSAAQLRDLCEPDLETPLACLSFFRGWSEGTEAAVQRAAASIFLQQNRTPNYQEWALMTAALRGFCPPEVADLDQVAAIALSYISEHPEKWHEPAGNVVATAISEAFPCSR